MPQEEDAPAVAETDSNIPNLFSSEVMAFAGDAAEALRTVLGPRAAVQPERVWIGLNPPSEAELAAQAAAEAAAEQARKDQEGDRTAPKKEAVAKQTDDGRSDEADATEKPAKAAKRPKASPAARQRHRASR